MKRKKWQLASLGFFVFVAISLLYSSSLVSIDKVLVQSGKLRTKVVLEANSPIAVVNAFYAKESPLTLVVEMENIIPTSVPTMPSTSPEVLEHMSFEKTGETTFRFLLRLREQVPYRVYSEGNRTIIELNQVLRGETAYPIEPDVEEVLAQRPLDQAFMSKLSVEEREDSLLFRARISSRSVAQVFTLEKPLRLVIDLLDTIYGETASVYPLEKAGIKRARVAQFQLGNPHSITRMVFDLDKPQQYDLRVDDGEVIVAFSKEKTTSPVLTLAAQPETPSPPPPATVSLPEPSPSSEPEKVRPKAVTGGPKTTNGEKKAQEADGTQEGQQEDQFKPRTIAETEVKYTGEIITLRFKDADLRDVILFLGDFAKLNVVFDPEVRGVVTCNLEDVPWDQALDILLRNNKLGKVLEGNVLRIAPISVLTREEEEQRRLQESRQLAGPVIVKTITLSYSKARDVMSLLMQKKSERGQITIDERTNTLIISDVRESLDLLEKLIAVLDTPTPQVSIEARIVEATSTFIRNLGIQWGFRGIADPFYGNQTSLQFPNKMLVDGALIPQGIVTKGIGGPLGGYAINLPAPAFTTAVGFSFANILDTFRLDMAISALETSGEGRIISCPKVTTQNNQAAEIIQGRQIPVQTVANFTVTTRYVNAALELKATPQITAEGTIIMTLEIQNNAADFANLVNGIPPITTQSAKTTVMVPDGGTTVIGGIYRTEDSITRERVPFLHSIPILGHLFRSFARTKQNRELLIFITPRIIK